MAWIGGYSELAASRLFCLYVWMTGEGRFRQFKIFEPNTEEPQQEEVSQSSSQRVANASVMTGVVISVVKDAASVEI